MWIADGWKDYEVLDTSSGEKLERWADYILVRPDPQLFKCLFEVEKGFAEDGRDDHEERKLRHAAFLVAENQTGGDGAARAAQARQHGKCLRDTDDEGIAQRDGSLLAWTCIIGESEQGRRQEQTTANDEQTVAEDGFHLFFKEETNDADGNHRHDDVEHVALVFIEISQALAACGSREHAFEDFPNLAAEHNEGAQHGGNVNKHGEHHVFVGVNVKDGRADGEVAATAHGKIFRETLDESEDKGFKCIHFLF